VRLGQGFTGFVESLKNMGLLLGGNPNPAILELERYFKALTEFKYFF
jgi:hypothetical protein